MQGYICGMKGGTIPFTRKHAWQYFRQRLEGFVWITGLVLMAVMSPQNTHASLCPLKMVNSGFCPGCGLGHSIAWLFRGDVIQSFEAHPLGILAVAVLLWRVWAIFRKPVFYY